MSFDLNHFQSFCNQLKIDSKESGLCRLGPRMYDAQKIVMRGIAQGLEEGVHDFKILKARQLGMSSIFLALDMYWMFQNRALTGALITHDDKAKQQFRTTLQLYYEGLPDEYKRSKPDDNRDQWVLGNGSRLQFRVAGIKKSPTSASLGRSGALAYLHATEVAFWADTDGIESLKASLAETNPNRLYVYESTANGFNHYEDMWNEAKRAVTQRAIFVSWWAKGDYSVAEDSPQYRMYFGRNGRITKDEREWIREVKTLYGQEITNRQIAWYRWITEEKMVDEAMREQEFPHTEYRAFVATGSQFFTSVPLSEAIKEVKSGVEPQRYMVKTGREFTDTTVDEVGKKGGNLLIWQEKVDGATYCLGADPAYGSSPDANNYCISVWRCYANRIEQVAEFVQVEMTTRQFAWVIVYLGGYYGLCSTNCEVNGPGQAVLNEIENMRRERHIPHGRGPLLKDVMTHYRAYLYRKYDSIYGAPSARHTLTTETMKERMLNILKDNFESGMAVVRSLPMLNEMKDLRRIDGGTPEAGSGGNDDRVMAASLALLVWNDQMRMGLIRAQVMWEAEVKRLRESADGRPQSGADKTMNRMVTKYLSNIGYLKDPSKDVPYRKTKVAPIKVDVKPGVVHGRPN
jgi:hypothetical protein